MNYKKYLASREWMVLKAQVRERSGGVCERCFNAPHEETHHVTYERIGHERIEDLIGICGACHRYLSGLDDYDPNATKIPSNGEILMTYECQCGFTVDLYETPEKRERIAINRHDGELHRC